MNSAVSKGNVVKNMYTHKQKFIRIRVKCQISPTAYFSKNEFGGLRCWSMIRLIIKSWSVITASNTNLHQLFPIAVLFINFLLSLLGSRSEIFAIDSSSLFLMKMNFQQN